jgi:hypothetical protein
MGAHRANTTPRSLTNCAGAPQQPTRPPGYRRDYLRALAQRVEVDAQGIEKRTAAHACRPRKHHGIDANDRTPIQREIVDSLYLYFAESTFAFEHFAADVARMMDANIISIDVTRPSRDGGRDGVSKYRLGLPQNCVTVEFAMEEKCYSRTNGVGVKAVSRLISRLRHRQFGILVTTFYLAEQAYTEIVDDGHPIIVCAGGDIAELLISKRGFRSGGELTAWLEMNYPRLNVDDENGSDGDTIPESKRGTKNL